MDLGTFAQSHYLSREGLIAPDQVLHRLVAALGNVQLALELLNALLLMLNVLLQMLTVLLQLLDVLLLTFNVLLCPRADGTLRFSIDGPLPLQLLGCEVPDLAGGFVSLLRVCRAVA